MDRIRFTDKSSMSLLKAERAILDEGQLDIGTMLSEDGMWRCAVGVLEDWIRIPNEFSAWKRAITPKTKRTLLSLNDGIIGTREQRCLAVAAWLRSQAN
jgi:hypothetical protein